jgi:hypothetical protein
MRDWWGVRIGGAISLETTLIHGRGMCDRWGVRIRGVISTETALNHGRGVGDWWRVRIRVASSTIATRVAECSVFGPRFCSIAKRFLWDTVKKKFNNHSEFIIL